MNESINMQSIMLPTDLERQQIFYWLQRISSVTAWHRILKYYRNWGGSIEDSLRLAVEKHWENETSLSELEHVHTLKHLAHCEKGVLRLSKGDKRIFKFDANGEFVMAGRILSHWFQMLDRIETGDNGINKHTPLWPQFCESLLTLANAWRECGPYIVERRYLDQPALVVYGDWLKKELTKMPFPDIIAPVPDPINNVFVKTNEWTPFTGIWEPIAVQNVDTTSVRKLFNSSPKPQPPFSITGSMNYLHGGSKAPRITVETLNENPRLDTTWRLLWRDDRYEDGTVPDVESQYFFAEPRKIRQRPVFWETGETPWADTEDRAPTGGTWKIEGTSDATVILRAGDKLPLYQGTEARWILSEKSD